jgi:hypothetical protein
MKTLRRLHALFRGHSPKAASGAFERHTRSFEVARTLVRVHQGLLVFWASASIESWPVLMEKRNLSLLWPVSWVQFTGEALGWKLILGFYLAGTLLGLAFPDVRAARFASWLAVFQHAAMINSFGKIYHDRHALVLVSFVLIFLPNIGSGPKDKVPRARRHGYTTVFWCAQAIMMLTYTMAGLGKLVFGVWQAMKGETGTLHPQALAIHVAENMIERRTATVLGDWLANHALIGWPLMLSTIYLQFFSLVAVCRPALHRWWGFGLIAFHIATGVFMSIVTTENSLLLAVFLAASPFAAAGEWSVRASLRSLPLFGTLFRFPQLRRRRIQ